MGCRKHKSQCLQVFMGKPLQKLRMAGGGKIAMYCKRRSQHTLAHSSHVICLNKSEVNPHLTHLHGEFDSSIPENQYVGMAYFTQKMQTLEAKRRFLFQKSIITFEGQPYCNYCFSRCVCVCVKELLDIFLFSSLWTFLRFDELKKVNLIWIKRLTGSQQGPPTSFFCRDDVTSSSTTDKITHSPTYTVKNKDGTDPPNWTANGLNPNLHVLSSIRSFSRVYH